VKAMDVDFRLVAATNKGLREMIHRNEFREDVFYRLNKGLREMIHRNEFREDVFYRLNTMTVEIPALSERTDDISGLVHFFLKSSGNGHMEVSEAVIQMLECYSWPGNVRELKNVVAQALRLNNGNMSKTAKLLGISRSTLYEKCRVHEL